MNKSTETNETIRVELLARTIIKIAHGRDNEGKPVYFKESDALKAGSKKIYARKGW